MAIGHPPIVRVRVGDPVEVKYRSADADTKRIMAAIVDLLPAEARHRREPTPEELARTMPSSWDGNAEDLAATMVSEADRRPGRD